MRIVNWYHSFKIKRLVREHPDVDPDEIRQDYYNRLNNGPDICLAILDARAPLNYGVDLVNSVEENFFNRMKRFGMDLVDSIMPR